MTTLTPGTPEHAVAYTQWQKYLDTYKPPINPKDDFIPILGPGPKLPVEPITPIGPNGNYHDPEFDRMMSWMLGISAASSVVASLT